MINSKNKGKKYGEIYGEKAEIMKERSINKTSLQNRNKKERKRIAGLGGKKVAIENSKRMKSGQASRMGKKSREFENEVAESLDYEIMFLPQSICDRIAVVDGNPILLEIKHKGQKLSPKQKHAQKLLGMYYKVIER
jgi:hypothetical protein